MTGSLPTTAAKPKNDASLSSEAALDAPVLPGRWEKLHIDKLNLAICVGLIAVVFICYASVVRNGFLIYDDNLYVTENTHVKAGLTWATVKWAFTTFDDANWHPVTWLSHALDASLFGPSPVGPHLVNVLFHALNAVLVFLFLQYATGFRWRSLMVAALFALHPINVESVAWAAERKTVLSTFFFLLAFYAYERYARKPEVQRYAWVVGLYALALMAKPQVITFPLLLLLWDYWPLDRMGEGSRLGTRHSEGSSDARAGSSSFSRRSFSGQLFSRRSFPRQAVSFLLLEKVPLLLLSAVSAVVTMEAQKAGGAVKDLSQYGLLLRIETAVIAYVRYLKMAVWPKDLVAMYPHPARLYPAWEVVGAALLLLLITASVLRARQQRYLAVGWFWFLGSLVPMIGLVQVGVQELANRYAYISFLGLYVMVVWLVANWAQSHSPVESRAIASAGVDSAKVSGHASEYAPAHGAGRWLAVPAFGCLLAFGIFTHSQVSYWHDNDSFFRRTLALTRDNYVAHSGLAKSLHNEGKDEEAMTEVRAVLAIHPDDPGANMIWADYEHDRGNLAAAIERYKSVIGHTDSLALLPKAYDGMGFTYRQMGKPAEAKKNFEAGLRAEPNQPVILVQLGIIAQIDENDTPAAVRDYTRAMVLQPTDVGLLLLANALLEEGGHDDQANAVLKRASGLSKNIEAAEKQAKDLLGEK